ncbi:MAG: GNAT family N-acetyltransferase [Chthoniobacterales bacterium]
MHFTYKEYPFDSSAYTSALNLRERVLRAPLNLAWEENAFAGEKDSFHIGCFKQEQLIATLVLMPVNKSIMKMRQVAVDFDYQRQGIGNALVRFAEEFTKQKGYRSITANARLVTLSFYKTLGYSAAGGSFMEVTLPHYKIAKDL